MSYGTVWACNVDQALSNRVQAAIATEGQIEPKVLIGEMMWHVSTSSEVEAAYASALAAENPNPGGDETVVTDPMILSVVQANMPAP
jgi:hypothetical protein